MSTIHAAARIVAGRVTSSVGRTCEATATAVSVSARVVVEGMNGAEGRTGDATVSTEHVAVHIVVDGRGDTEGGASKATAAAVYIAFHVVVDGWGGTERWARDEIVTAVVQVGVGVVVDRKGGTESGTIKATTSIELVWSLAAIDGGESTAEGAAEGKTISVSASKVSILVAVVVLDDGLSRAAEAAIIDVAAGVHGGIVGSGPIDREKGTDDSSGIVAVASDDERARYGVDVVFRGVHAEIGQGEMGDVDWAVRRVGRGLGEDGYPDGLCLC